MDVDPIRYTFSLHELRAFIKLRFTILSLREIKKSRGFFSPVVAENEWVKRPMEMILAIDLPTCTIDWGHLDADTVASGQSFFAEETPSNVTDIGFFKIKSLARFETVNAHQWQGVTPVTSMVHLKGGRSHEKEREPALWDIATFDQITGQRLMIVRTHALRDDVFQCQNWVQSVIDWTVRVTDESPVDLDDSDQLDEKILAEIVAETPLPWE